MTAIAKRVLPPDDESGILDVLLLLRAMLDARDDNERMSIYMAAVAEWMPNLKRMEAALLADLTDRRDELRAAECRRDGRTQ